MRNLPNCKGRRFTAKIDGVETRGRIQVKGSTVFLCQNVTSGADCEDKFGYRYSWIIGNWSELLSRGENDYITDFRLIPPSLAEIEAYKDWQAGDVVVNGSAKWTVIFRSRELVVCKKEDGWATSNFTCEELYERGFRLKADPVEPEPVELTMDQIAEKFGVAVENLKIKKD